jgi:hypothetical protein
MASARSRFTLQLALRLLAWGSGSYPYSWLRRRGDGHRVLRVPLKTMLADLGIDPKKKPADVLRHDIMPAVDEIRQLSDLIVEIEPWYAPSIRAPRGRVLGVDVLVGDVETRTVPAPAAKAEVLPMPMLGFGLAPPGSDATDEDIAF